MACGHSFCDECIIELIKHSKGRQTLKCPTCRLRVNISEISYIMDDLEEKKEELIEVKGSYGTKIEGIIRHLKQLEQVDEFSPKFR